MGCGYNCENNCLECDYPDLVIEHVKGYNKALEDLWKLATSKFDEVMDFQNFAECIKELKK